MCVASGLSGAMNEQRLEEEKIPRCGVAGLVGGRWNGGNVELGDAAAAMSSGNDAERSAVFIGEVEVNSNGEQFVENGLGRLAVGQAVARPESSNGAGVGMSRNRDDDVLMCGDGPVCVGVLVEEECIDRKCRPSECVACESVERYSLELDGKFGTGRQESAHTVGEARAMSKRPLGGVRRNDGEERAQLVFVQG